MTYKAFDLLQEESRSQKMPESFETDLNIDHDELSSKKPDKFIWILRPHGTQLIISKDKWGDCYVDYDFGPRTRYYIYQKGKLKQVSKAAAKEFYRMHIKPPARSEKVSFI